MERKNIKERRNIRNKNLDQKIELRDIKKNSLPTAKSKED